VQHLREGLSIQFCAIGVVQVGPALRHQPTVPMWARPGAACPSGLPVGRGHTPRGEKGACPSFTQACRSLSVACYYSGSALKAAGCMLCIACRLVHAACFMSHAAGWILPAACCMLHAASSVQRLGRRAAAGHSQHEYSFHAARLAPAGAQADGQLLLHRSTSSTAEVRPGRNSRRQRTNCAALSISRAAFPLRCEYRTVAP
jgi:hypothetical protein